VKVALELPVVGLRMKSNCVTSVSFPGSNTPSGSGHARSTSFQVIDVTGMSTSVCTAPPAIGDPPRVVLMFPFVSAPAPPATVVHPLPSVPHDPSSGSLVSPTRVMFGSGAVDTASQTTAAPAAPPLAHPFGMTSEV
jgi:hypothetical protein